VVPKPLRVVDGEVFAYLVEIVTYSPHASELAVEAPDLLYYHEGAFFVKVEYGGRTYAYCPFMWVDSDVSLLRGLLVGWPKKLARVALTKLHPLLPGFEKPRRGLRLGGYVARAGSTLYRVRVTLESDESTGALPLITEYPFLLARYFAGIAPGTATVNELLEVRGDVRAEAWRGVGEVDVVGGVNDELGSLRPVSNVVGYYFNALLKLRSIEVLGRLEGF
jgi:acetoacetate decarboxylase